MPEDVVREKLWLWALASRESCSSAPFRSRVWQRGLDGQTTLKHNGWPEGTPTMSAPGSWEWIISSGNMGSTYAF